MDYLKLLDMTEQEQRKWLVLHHILKYKQPQPNQIRWESLADLAFRLRDEAVNKTNNYFPARMYEVYKHYLQSQGMKKEIISREIIWEDVDVWFVSVAKPIHWIAAALIAKGDE